MPYLAYACDDKRKEWKSLATAWVGALLKASGIDEVITVDVHSTEAQDLFPLPLVSLSPANIFAQEMARFLCSMRLLSLLTRERGIAVKQLQKRQA